MEEDQAGISRGHSSSLRNEGPNPEKGKGPASPVSAMNPTGGAEIRRVAGKPYPKQDLLERILSRSNMLKAWRRVKANKGAPGIDNMPVDDFLAYAREHWETIRASLLAGTYQPLPVNRKGPYRLAKTLATQSGMTNKWLKDQGLLSVKDLWVRIHYPATAR